MAASKCPTAVSTQLSLRHRLICRCEQAGPSHSIRRYIREQCPSPGIDRTYREQPREATLQLTVLPVKYVLPPGGKRDMKISTDEWEAITIDSGRVIVVPGNEHPGSSTAFNKGSFTTLCEVLAAQTAGKAVTIKIVSEERVAIQALGNIGGIQRAQAAALPDRWVYYVRAGAVEDLARELDTSTPSHLQHPDQPPVTTHGAEVHTALRDCLDAAEDVQRLMQHLSELMVKLCEENPGSDYDTGLVSAAETEWDDLLYWASAFVLSDRVDALPVKQTTLVETEPEGQFSMNGEMNQAAAGQLPEEGSAGQAGHQARTSSPSVPASASRSAPASPSDTSLSGSNAPQQPQLSVTDPGDVSMQSKLHLASRLSYAPFAAVVSPALLGWSEEDIGAKQKKCMQITDLGVRLEAASEYLRALKDRAATRVMLQQLGGS